AEEQKVIRVAEFASVSELASTMGVKPNEIIGACFQLGLVVTINQRLDMETIEFIADEFGYEIEKIEEYGADAFEEPEQEVSEEEMVPRAPIVTVMGHVDHGKTSLLDYIRRTSVVAGEVGGITQHIGAYEVQTDSGPVTFLDTPGHEAFTAMRARGAQLTDIVVLVIAADDKVMPQTVEAINHAKAAGVPMVVAINKVDRPDADPGGAKQQLTQHNVIVEDFGGDVVAVPVSAKTGENVEKLLEMILLQADLLELKAEAAGLAKGTVVEAQLDRGRGPVATILVEKGTLSEGDPFLCGLHSGRVRAMMDERGKRVENAGPSQPVVVVGFNGLPQPGDGFHAVGDEKEARELSQKRQQIKREQEFAVREATSLSDVRARVESGELNELPMIVKGDTDGSVEALSDSLHKLSTEEVQVKVIHQGVGGITESDVLLAQTSDAIIVGFHVRPDRNAREAAEQMGVDIRLYEIIYEAVEEIKKGLEGLLKPELKEEVLGTLEVRDTFRIPKAGTIAGCYVTDGLIRRNAQIRLVRDGVVIYDGNVDSLRRFKDDAREVKEGFECGVGLENFNDIKVGDVLEVYEQQEIARTL
ncbi:MAG: translation initiation factor IF-2, partial [bacterium]